MVQSAFRNLLNTQYEQNGKLVAKAYLTYEEVFKQIKRDFCDEEANIIIAYLLSTKFPTRKEQEKRYLAFIKRSAMRELEKASKQKVVTREDVLRANKIDVTKKEPHYWNEPL